MKRSGKKREGDISPDLTSFSDIANLLIIFFILTTSLVRPFGRPMDMPSSAKPPEQQQKSDTPTVRLTADRIVFSEGEKKEREVQRKKSGKLQRQDRFTYDALHDSLTGLYNQTAFEILFHDSDKDHLAVLIANINDYEALKKQEGRARTDQIIRRVSEVLRGSFRSVDDICRLKEDEFVVIMTRMTSAMRALVFDKVEQVNTLLQHPGDDLPPVSLSVGVAFSDREKPEGDIFQDADTALYRMKEVRHCGCAVF